LSEFDKGRIDIAATAVFSTYFLPRAMGDFIKHYPGVEIQLHTGNSHEVITKLLEGGTDFGFGGVVKAEPDITFSLIHREPYIFVVGKDHPLGQRDQIFVDDLKVFPFIWREHGTLIRRKMEEMMGGSQCSTIFRNVIEVQNVETVKRLVEQGIGVTIIPQIAVSRELAGGGLKQVDFSGLDLHASYYLLHLKKRPLSRRARVFLQFLIKTSQLTNTEQFLEPMSS
jgi:DNA-binding transcriptional LysR family regulator